MGVGWVHAYRPRRVAERDEDAAPREALDRDVNSRRANAIDDGLHTGTAGNLQHLLGDRNGRVVLIRRAGDRIGDNELIDTSRRANILLTLRACADHLVTL